MIRISLLFLLLNDSYPSSNPIVRIGPPSPIDLEAVVDRACRKYMGKNGGTRPVVPVRPLKEMRGFVKHFSVKRIRDEKEGEEL
jgi:hypothetical protein